MFVIHECFPYKMKPPYEQCEIQNKCNGPSHLHAQTLLFQFLLQENRNSPRIVKREFFTISQCLSPTVTEFMIGPFSSIKENKNNKVVDNWNKVFGALLFRREFNCPSLILHDSINDSVNCYFSF